MGLIHTSREQLHQWLTEAEGTNIEFKEAKQNYHFDKLMDYCVALANEGGGKIILGVTDRRPSRVELRRACTTGLPIASPWRKC